MTAASTAIRWRLDVLCHKQGIAGPSALRAALGKRGYALSVAQASRLLRQTPGKVDIAMLVALCKVLDCGLQDLIDVGVPKTPVSAAPATSRQGELAPEERLRLLGPSASALRPIAERPALRRVD